MRHLLRRYETTTRVTARRRVVFYARLVIAVSAVIALTTNHPARVRAQDLEQILARLAIPAEDFSVGGDDTDDASVKGGVGTRSQGGQLARALQKAIQAGTVPLHDAPMNGQRGTGFGRRATVDRNTQVNDAALDHVLTFPGTRPFEVSIQSETSIVANGKHIVVGYNSSAGAVVQQFPEGLFFTEILFSGYSVSHDSGVTWTSGFVPPVDPVNAPFTFGDPSLALDRHGNVFYASLGVDAGGKAALILNKSIDRGSTFARATVVALDDGSDKEWLAIGPDPAKPARDNIYVTWTSIQSNGSELRLARSTDGGVTWTTRTLFAPVDDGVNSSFIQFSNPVVDATTGRLYIPFLHFSDIDADNVRVLASDDGGATFHFLAFNAHGAVDPFAYPNVTPGALNDCGGGGLRNVLHQGTSVGPGRFGSFRYTQATRLVTQPAAAASRGRLLIALQRSTSPLFADPIAGSEINVLYSPDGGTTWTSPLRVASTSASDPQHVHPAIALGQNGNRAWVTYYVQQADGRLRTDIATLHVDGNDLRLDGVANLSTQAFDLTPSNIPRPTPTNPFATTNYDRVVVPCYDIGEYMSVAVADDPKNPVAAWGDNRNTWTPPTGSAAPTVHAQPDVFSGRLNKR